MVGIISAIVFSLLPFFYLFSQIQIVGNFTYAFANIAGFFGATLLLWEFILGIKEISKKIAPNPAVFIKLHIMLGVWGMFFVLIHPILEMFSYMEKITFLFFPDISSTSAVHITFGRFALLLVLFVWLSSTFLRSKVSYKKWLNIHYLSYPMMFFVFIHALDIGSYLRNFIVLKLYWFGLMILYFGIVVWRLSFIIKKKMSSNITPLSK